MEVNSVEQLCKFLISRAFQRCRMLDDLCRLSVSLKPSPTLIQISVSDTGVGSSLEEFQVLKYQNDPIWASKWDGVLCIATTNSLRVQRAKLIYTRSRKLPVGTYDTNTDPLTSTADCSDFSHMMQRNTVMFDLQLSFKLGQQLGNALDMINEVVMWDCYSPEKLEIPLNKVLGRLRIQGISDKEIHHLKIDLKEVVSSRRLVRLTSATKNGANFSGTEVSFSVCEETDGIVTMLSLFLQKILILKAPKIALDLIVESGGNGKLEPESIILQNSCRTIPMHAVNIDYLKLGVEEYVSKHGNRLAEACHSCFSDGKNLKVGNGIACSRGNQQGGRQVMEAVIIISEISMPDQPTCFRLHGKRTEVLCFRDFIPCSVSQSSLDALTSINWKNYGLVLKSVGEVDGVTLLEWEDLPPCSHIDIVLHRYRKQVTTLPCTESDQIDRLLTTKAVKHSLTELKKKNAGVLLSERAVKICRYAPDLAKTISGLILSSHDSNFQAECLSLLGLQSAENEKNMVEKCIKEKIISVVAANDSNTRATREASTLFSDDAHHQGSHGLDDEYEIGDETFCYMDL